MRIVTREEWGARFSAGFRAAPLPAKELYLHHSVTSAANGPATIRNLEQIGQSRFGGGISYTFAITPDGTVYEGHGVDRQGAHTGGRNSIARAIVWVGNYDVANPTPEMVMATIELIKHGAKLGWWPLGLTGGHRDAPGASTACPGRFAYALIDTINGAVKLNAPSTQKGKDENMLINRECAPGKGGFRYIIPVGKMSGIINRAWVSFVVNGPTEGKVHIWAQDDDSGIKDWALSARFRDGRSDRVWLELPDGTTQVNVQYVFPEGGTIAFEMESK